MKAIPAPKSLLCFLFLTIVLISGRSNAQGPDSPAIGEPDSMTMISGTPDSTLLSSVAGEDRRASAAPAEQETTPDRFPDGSVTVEVPDVVMKGIDTEIKFTYAGEVPGLRNGSFELTVNGKPTTVAFESGVGIAAYAFDTEDKVEISGAGISYEQGVTPIPLWLSIIPPLLAILMALVFREVITALFTGIFFGAAIIHVYMVGILGIGGGLLSVLDTYVIKAIADSDHVSVIVFSMLIGAIVAVISRNGGMKGVVNRVSKFARNARSGQLATWFLGIGIFFDDYANTLVVGNTMRPVTDRLRISREKLSYLVDSTAAPISAIAFITTWIGAELGYIQNGIDKIAADGFALPGDPSPYSIFISSLQYSFYPILTLCFMLMLILMNRDFGPMLKAERRARETGQVNTPALRKAGDKEKAQEIDDLEPLKKVKPRAYNAVLPILVIIFGTVVGLIYTGLQGIDEAMNNADPAKAEQFRLLYEGSGLGGKLSLIIGKSNSYAALIWASLGGLLTALALSLGQRLMNLEESIETVLSGFKTMLHAMIILILAWALAEVTAELHTADFITQLLGGGVKPTLLPLITFILAAIVSFSTGSSWGTMAILYPLLIPAVWQVSISAGMDPETALSLLYNTVACVLAGSVLGDHCSPISDTTILSSLATSTNHIDHVRTQLPYALTVGGVSVLAGTLPAAYGMPFWLSLPISLAVLYGIIRIFGKPVPKYEYVSKD